MSDDLAVLALDAGQSRVRARAVEGDMPPARVGRPQLELDAVRTNTPVLPQLARRTAQAVAELWPQGVPGNLHLAVGSTGLASNETADQLLDLVRDLGVRHVGLAHDAITCYLGALGSGRGVVVAAGTGTVALGVGPDATARVDGWGHQLGDDGSGFWIGRQGLRAVLRAFDGRGPATALSELVDLQFAYPEDAYLAIQRDPDWVRRVASYAKAVADLAPRDEVCADIIAAAAERLAHTACTALSRCGELDATDTPAVATVGRCFDSALLRDMFPAFVRERVPSARFVPPLGDALDGAAALFELMPDSPLAAQVSHAR